MKILFVCRGNICRSPIAHGLFSALLEKGSLGDGIKIDSAGTHAWHSSTPDPHSQQIARQHGIDITDLRSRLFVKEDLQEYNLIISMDRYNLAHIQALSDAQHQPDRQDQQQLKLLLNYAEDDSVIDVPDPYGAGIDGFALIYDLIEQGCMGLLKVVKKAIVVQD